MHVHQYMSPCQSLCGNKDEDPEKYLSNFNAFMELQCIDGTRIKDSKLFISSFLLQFKRTRICLVPKLTIRSLPPVLDQVS